jgi:uncharacterized membrane protein YdjX (TVP38/TMEM64 family)
MNARSALRMSIPVGVILLASGIAWKLGYFNLDQRDDVLALARAADGSAFAAPLFVAASVAAIMLCLPATILTVLAGALFGFGRGALVAWLGSMIGTLLAHTIAHSVGRRTAERMFGGHRMLERLRRQSDLRSLITLRVIPLGPFGVLAYVTGLARVPLSRMLLASGIGVIPTILAYSFAGASLRTALESGGTEARRALAIAGGVSLTIIVGASVLAWMNNRRETAKSS